MHAACVRAARALTELAGLLLELSPSYRPCCSSSYRATGVAARALTELPGWLLELSASCQTRRATRDEFAITCLERSPWTLVGSPKDAAVRDLQLLWFQRMIFQISASHHEAYIDEVLEALPGWHL